MSYQYAPLPKIKICANPDCGKEFTVARSTRNAKYCCQECADKIRLAKSRAYKADKRAEDRELKKASANEFISRPRIASGTVISKHKQQTDWSAIIAICEQHNVSYGYAVAMGLLD